MHLTVLNAQGIAVDGLTNEERIAAWRAAWSYSLEGWAIVEEDFIFRSVNPQWLEILGVLPNEFLGKSFEDITPADVREQDVQNAKLTIDGKIPSYLIHKRYQFSDGTTKNIVLLVVRVPVNTNEPFQFFLSRILLDEDKFVGQVKEKLKSATSPLPASRKLIDWIVKYWGWIAGTTAAATGITLKLWELI